MSKHLWLSMVFALAASLLPALARAEVKGELVDYKQGDTALQGFFAYDDAVKGKRPTVVLVHGKPSAAGVLM